MSLEPLIPINLIGEINNSSNLLEFPKIHVDKKLFQSLEGESSDNKPLDIVDIDKRSIRMSKTGMRKAKSEAQNQQNVSYLLSSTLQNDEKILPHKSDRELLEKAINANNQEIIDLLWKYGENEYWMPALHYAVYLGEKIDVTNLLNFGADPNFISKNAGGNALDVALSYAVKTKDLSLANLLVDYVDNASNKWIVSFSFQNYIEGLEWIFSKNKVSMSPEEGGNYLWQLIREQSSVKSEIIQCLLEHGADVKMMKNCTFNQIHTEECSILTPAILQGDIEIIRLLVQYGAPINVNLGTKSEPHYTFANPLFSARNKNIEITRILLEAGATISTAFYAKQHPYNNKVIIYENWLLSSAMTQGNFDLELMKLLIEFGHNTDFPISGCVLRADLGYSPLQFAILNNRIDVIELLLSLGANPDYYGKTISPLKMAIDQGNQKIINLLLKYGADIDKT